MATVTTEEASKRPDRYGPYKPFKAAVFAATERLNAGQETADDMALIEEVIDGHASFIAALEAHVAEVNRAAAMKENSHGGDEK